MVTPVIGKTVSKVESSPAAAYAAARLGPLDRIALSVQTLAHAEPISDIASRNGVSRKFLYKQAAKADKALKETFGEEPQKEKVLFHLPVTKSWITQFVLAQILIGHTAYRGIQELLAALFDYRNMSIGTIHNIATAAAAKARRVNDAEDVLSLIEQGAHDEIYQAGDPVLVGADVGSTYCYLLAAEKHCDETTWGVHLLDLVERGFAPAYTIGDGGRGLRAGQAAALDGVTCHGDVFHAERDLGSLAYYLENRARGCTSTREKLESRMERAKKNRKGAALSKRLALARQAEAKAVDLARDIRILADWIQNDILSLAGPDRTTRRGLFDFVVEELREREHLRPHRIRPVRRLFENQRDNLLAFAGVLDEKIAEIAMRFEVPVFLVHQLCELQGADRTHPAYWQREGLLRKKLPEVFHLR
jgi:hypothetical protein